MATRRLAKSGRAAIFGRFVGILAIFLEVDTYNLFCPSFLSRVMGKPIFRPIGLKMAILSHKNLYFGHFLAISQNVNIAKWALRKSYLLLGFKRYSHAVFCMLYTRRGGIYSTNEFLRFVPEVAQGGSKWLVCHKRPFEPP